MAAIRLDADACRAAVLTYRRRVRSLLGLVRNAVRLDPRGPAHAALAELRSELELDVCSRSTLEGQGLMTAPEAKALEPALRQARIALAFPFEADPGAWETHLQAADACFLVALARLNGTPAWSSLRVRRPPRRAPARRDQPPGGGPNPRMASNR